MNKQINITDQRSFSVILASVTAIATEIAGPQADSVDQSAQFPVETIDALKRANVLSACLPNQYGGAGCDVAELSSLCATLGQECASSAMILAMHFIQVGCLMNHCGKNLLIKKYLARLAKQQRLIASVTSEIGVDGDLRRSICFLEQTGSTFSLTKNATTISYAEFADDLLVTARSNPEANQNDQRLVLCLFPEYRLELSTQWDTLGMRGTCSPGGKVSASGENWQVLSTPFAEIAAETMVPYSHILWSACWLGIAMDAVAKTRKLIQQKARKNPSAIPQGAVRLSAIEGKLQTMRAEHESTVQHYLDLLEAKDKGGLSNFGFLIKINNLKLNASRLVTEIVLEAIEICGIAAYRNDTEFSLGRHLRDALSAPLMVNNERIHEANARMHLLYKGRNL